ncbi:MAG: tetratricopeptide repeat protein, partial [Candidatus Sungbacteria bacterium]|nr:tetratricopeptide repeat protein [Candidatus Sungbacteria bacterium]
LLAQTALRAGNIQKAIQSTENAKLAAPFDIGIAFQLGLLYYQNSNLDQARGEFERAVSLNQQYSNARYFLGLIYSRTGNTAGAIAQFEEIAKYNPDNQEVKRILDNLHAGRPALDGIAPPATPPEQRNQPPVAENQQSSGGASTPQAASAPRPRGKR